MDSDNEYLGLHIRGKINSYRNIGKKIYLAFVLHNNIQLLRSTYVQCVHVFAIVKFHVRTRVNSIFCLPQPKALSDSDYFK